MVCLGYIYTGKVKSLPQDASICADAVCPHDACWPAISFAVELVYASYVFQVSELVSLFQVRLIYFFVDYIFVIGQSTTSRVTNWSPILFVPWNPLDVEFSSDNSMSLIKKNRVNENFSV